MRWLNLGTSRLVNWALKDNCSRDLNVMKSPCPSLSLFGPVSLILSYYRLDLPVAENLANKQNPFFDLASFSFCLQRKTTTTLPQFQMKKILAVSTVLGSGAYYGMINFDRATFFKWNKGILSSCVVGTGEKEFPEKGIWVCFPWMGWVLNRQLPDHHLFLSVSKWHRLQILLEFRIRVAGLFRWGNNVL